MGRYKCKRCSAIYESKREDTKAFRCKSCGLSQMAKDKVEDIGGQPSTLIQDVQGIQKADDKPKEINFQTEQINAEVPSLNQTNAITGIQTNTNQSQKQEGIKGFSDDTIAKYFSALDKMMKGKTNEWDITDKEEKLLGELWADFANEKYKGISQEQSKLAVAGIATATIYLPRIALYLQRIYEQNKTKKKKQKEQEGENDERQQENQDTQKYEIPTEKNLGDWANRKPITS